MHRIVYRRGAYIVKKIRKGYYVYNKNRKDKEHTHIHTLKTSKQLIDMIYKRKVPISHYLRVSILRICKDEKLIKAVENKIAKDKEKQVYRRY